MNWIRIIAAGVVGGVVTNLVSFVLHGIIMADTYTKYPIFTKEEASPLWFFLIAICIGIPTAILFAKTYRCWGAGVMGGVKFGFWVGLVWFFAYMYNPIVLEGFPYFLAWCWGGINLIVFVVYGASIALVYKE